MADELKREGYTHVLAFAISSGLSGTYNTMCSVLNEEMDEQEAADALRPLVEQASATGANTLLVEVTDSASGRAAYEDSRLEPLFEGFDPLQLLCRFAKEAKIQVFALADPGAPSPEESGAAALAD